MINTDAAIEELRARWSTPHDLDRAEEVFKIRDAGVSRRGLANKLGCSEGLLRHLLRAREASPEDQLLARQGVITTRELVRRSAGMRESLSSRSSEAVKFERTKTADHVSHVIRDWILKERLPPARVLQVITVARDILRDAERFRNLLQGTAPRILQKRRSCYAVARKNGSRKKRNH